MKMDDKGMIPAVSGSKGARGGASVPLFLGQKGLAIIFPLERQQQKLGDDISGELHIQRACR